MSTPSIVRGLLRQIQHFLQPGQAFLRVDVEDLGLRVRVQFAAVVERFEHVDFVAQRGGLLELQRLRRFLHLVTQLSQQPLLVAVQEHLQPLDVLAVVLLADPQIAGRGALLDGGQQARAEPPPALVGFFDVQAAGAELEDLLQHLDRTAQAPADGERTVQLDASILRLARQLDAREILAGGDHQVRKRLVVLQVVVVLRLDVLDQPGLHQQGVDFALAFQVVDVADLGNPVRRPQLLRGRLGEVAAGPRAEVLGLADVDHPAGGVLHQVDAGRLRKLAHLGGRPPEPKVVGGLVLGGLVVGSRRFVFGLIVIHGGRPGPGLHPLAMASTSRRAADARRVPDPFSAVPPNRQHHTRPATRRCGIRRPAAATASGSRRAGCSKRRQRRSAAPGLLRRPDNTRRRQTGPTRREAFPAVGSAGHVVQRQRGAVGADQQHPVGAVAECLGKIVLHPLAQIPRSLSLQGPGVRRQRREFRPSLRRRVGQHAALSHVAETPQRVPRNCLCSPLAAASPTVAARRVLTVPGCQYLAKIPNWSIPP